MKLVILETGEIVIQKLILFILAAVAPVAFAKKVLLVGDSQSCMGFGQKFIENQMKAGNEVVAYCTISSSPYHWIDGKRPGGKTCYTCSGNGCRNWTSTGMMTEMSLCGGNGQVPKFSVIMEKEKPQDVFLEFGTNALLADEPLEDVAEMATIVKASGAGCHWVGPPHFAGKTEEAKARDARVRSYYSSLRTQLENPKNRLCQVLDGSDQAKPRTAKESDKTGLHPQGLAADRWVRQV